MVLFLFGNRFVTNVVLGFGDLTNFIYYLTHFIFYSKSYPQEAVVGGQALLCPVAATRVATMRTEETVADIMTAEGATGVEIPVITEAEGATAVRTLEAGVLIMTTGKPGLAPRR